jgi:tetratricopeptide (TPR) repeat protein
VDEPPAENVVADFGRELKLDLPLLLATPEVIGVYNVIARNLYDRVQDLGIPTSFLLNERGEIVKLYRGAVEVAQIVRDARSIPANPEERLARGLPFPGLLLFGELSRNDFALANELAELGYGSHAERLYHAALEANPESAKIRYNLGTVLLQQRRTVEAREAFQAAVEKNPRFAEAYNNLGLALAAEQREEEALAAYRRALEIRPRFAEVQNNVGSLQARRGRVAEATAAFQAAVAVRPDLWRAHFNLGTALAEAGRIDEALVPLRKAFELAPSARVCARLVKLAIQAGQMEEARQALKKGLEQWKDDPELIGLGERLSGNKDAR